MPLYEYDCPDCGRREERLIRASRYSDMKIMCTSPGCFGMPRRIISLPAAVAPDEMPRYYDHGLGQHISSRSERRSVMRARGLEESDGGAPTTGARGTLFSLPGKTVTAARPSGAYEDRRSL